MHFSKSLCLLLSAATTGLQAAALTSSPGAKPKYPSRQIPAAPFVASRPYPNTTIAGITVIDTPIVRAAREYMTQHSSPGVYKHQMRAWLFGSLIVGYNETTRHTTDLEIQAISAMLHDLGWDMTPNSTITTLEKRFEVDGAVAAKKWLEQHGGAEWDYRRLQLVWDAIALHTTRNIGYYKESEIYTTSMGISTDYDGLKPGVTQDSYDQIVAEFPNDDLKQVTNDTLVWFCQTKANTTYDTWMQTWGDHYVDGYTSVGNNRFYTIFKNL